MEGKKWSDKVCNTGMLEGVQEKRNQLNTIGLLSGQKTCMVRSVSLLMRIMEERMKGHTAKRRK